MGIHETCYVKSLSLSLSVCIYIYIYIYITLQVRSVRRATTACLPVGAGARDLAPESRHPGALNLSIKVHLICEYKQTCE